MNLPYKLNRSKIISSIATLFSGSVVAQGMTTIALLFTARQLKVDGYGQYAACITITSMLSIIFSLGLDVWLLREGGRNPSQISKIAGSIITIKAIIGAIWILVLWFLVPLINQQTFPASILHLSIILLWSDTLLATCLSSFKAVLHNNTPAILEAVADAVWLGLTLVLISLGKQQPEAYLSVRVLISLLSLCVAIVFLFRKFGLQIDTSIARRALSECFPFASSEFLAMVTMRVDVVIVSIYLGSIATGLYSPAVGLVNIAFVAPQAVYLVMMPVLSNLFSSHPQQASKTALRTIGLSLSLGMGLTLVFFVGSPLVVWVLGDSFIGSVPILKILSWVLLFKCGSYAMATILIATNQQIKRTNIQIISAVSNIGLNLLVVNRFGILGVASVYVFTEIILFGGYSFFALRRMRFHGN